MPSTKTSAQLTQELLELKREHDDVDRFYGQLEQNVTDTYNNYRRTSIGIDIAADVLLSLVNLAATGYRIVVLKSNVSNFRYAWMALQFVYKPIFSVITSFPQKPAPSSVQSTILRAIQSLDTMARFADDLTTPSFWANTYTNIRDHQSWRKVFSAKPEDSILQVRGVGP